ncbi:RluA family pseudouridine synthase [Clostridium cylindrosporum]|uniref:Pseudouridine synthase n=1 Tax=Clostridium cylindrosporum DSM 605 TaxID=1121307 RepID=A0A0J8DAV0_CLOCY|nr:RluA family pseudouridine synthase [Clostridium cylindrosporum]KMT21439.1 pseudouridine synthase [Clostridium cylindrosporum DSM 605]
MFEEILNFTIDKEDANKRIDVYLSENIEDMSRSQIKKLIDDETVKVNGKIIKSNYKTKENDSLEITIPEPKNLELIAEDIDIDIIYEDDDIAVVNKAKGMVVHPAAGNYTGTLVNALLYKCNNLSSINGVIRPGIVHRIDKDTSGVLVIAKNDMAHRSLSEQIKNHTVKRCYLALTEGVIKVDSGTVNAPIGRHPVERKKMAITEKNSRHAITHFKVIERFQRNTLIEARLETGRTHQIRVHMAHLGYPLVGDPVYGFKKQKFNIKGQALHARTLGFMHPRTGEYVEFSSDIPDDFKRVLSRIRNVENS